MVRRGDPSDVHGLTDQVVGIFDDDSVTDDLTAAGFETELMAGTSGHHHLDPTGEAHGLGGSFARLAAAFGDERRILQEFQDAVESGRVVVAAHIEDDDGDEAVRIMVAAGGEQLWRFEGGTHVPVSG